MGKRPVVVNESVSTEASLDNSKEVQNQIISPPNSIEVQNHPIIADKIIAEKKELSDVIEYRVAAKTPVALLASAIAKCFLEARISKRKFIVRALGQEPINQALKGIIRAISMLAQNGHYVVIKPFWIDDIEKEKAGNMNVMGFHILEDIR